jgi:hypothetical protein
LALVVAVNVHITVPTTFLAGIEPEDRSTKLLQNMGNFKPNDMALYPTRTGSSVAEEFPTTSCVTVK